MTTTARNLGRSDQKLNMLGLVSGQDIHADTLEVGVRPKSEVG